MVTEVGATPFVDSINMEINVEVSGDHIETVEVVDSLRDNPGPVLAGEQSLIVTHGQEVLVPSTEVSPFSNAKSMNFHHSLLCIHSLKAKYIIPFHAHVYTATV